MAITITPDGARKRILRFVKRHNGKSVLFWTLDESEKYDYCLTKQYNYFFFLGSSANRIERAINNANHHRSNGYDIYSEHEHMVIGS